MASVGDTFWLKSPRSRNPPHLYFLIAVTPCGLDGILANMSDYEDCIDKVCTLEIGEHGAVIKRSVIKYLEMIRSPLEKLDEQVRWYPATKSHSASANLIKKIQEGALISDFARPEYVELIRGYMAR